MTSPFYPGYSPGYPPQVPAAPPGFVQTQVPGYAPAPIYPVPGFAPQQPQPQYQQQGYPPQPPQMPQFPTGTDLNQRLYGPQFPQELQGKTLAEAVRYYGIMREDFIRRGQPQQQQPQPQPQPGQYQQPIAGRNYGSQFQTAQPQVPGGQQQPDPMKQMIQEAVHEAIGPVVQHQQKGAVEEAYIKTRQKFPDWQLYEPEVMQSLQGGDQATLGNQQAWEAAYYFVKGRRATFPQQPQGPGYQPTPMGPPQVQGYQPQPPQGFQYPPQPQQNVGFVEGPTPAAPQYGPPGQQGGADPRDEIFARRFGMPVEVYRMAKSNPDAAAQFTLRARQPQQTVQYQQGPPMPGQQQQVPGYPPQQFPFAPQMNGQPGGGYGW